MFETKRIKNKSKMTSDCSLSNIIHSVDLSSSQQKVDNMKNIFNTNKLKIDFKKQINLNIRKVIDKVNRTLTYKVDFQYPPEMKKECLQFLKNEKATEKTIYKVISVMKERNLIEIDMPVILQQAPSSFFDKIDQNLKQKVKQ